MRKVKLIYPANIKKQSSIYPPLGLGYISAYLKKYGVDCEIIDLTFDKLEKIETFKDINAVYGISCTTSTYNSVKEITQILKTIDPHGIICVGGSHPTVLPEYTISNDSNIDVVVIGEGEYTMFDIASNRPLEFVEGIYYRNGQNIIKNKPREPIQNIDSLPFPDNKAFPIDKYFSKGFRELTMITTRGCVGNCTYCQPTLKKIFGEKVKYRSAKNIVDEIEYLIDTFNLDMICFSDDTFTFSKKRTMEISQEILNRKINILWRCQTRVNLDEETMVLMKKSGCFLIMLGVESGSQQILDNINKHIKIDEIKETFRIAKKVGILTHAYLMIGNEGETNSTINETISLIKVIKPFNANVSITTPYPGTYLYDSLNKKSEDWSKYNHLLDNTVTESKSMIENKRKVEMVIKNESQKINDIFYLLKDFTIIKIMCKMSMRNKFFAFRMGGLFFSSLLKQGMNVTNKEFRNEIT